MSFRPPQSPANGDAFAHDTISSGRSGVGGRRFESMSANGRSNRHGQRRAPSVHSSEATTSSQAAVASRYRESPAPRNARMHQRYASSDGDGSAIQVTMRSTGKYGGTGNEMVEISQSGPRENVNEPAAEEDNLLRLFRSDDTLRERWNKMMQLFFLATGVVLGFLAAAAYLPSAVGGKCDPACSAHMAMAFVPLLSTAVVEVPVYMYCRHHRRTPHLAMDIILVAKAAATATLAFAEPIAPAQCVLTLLAAATVVAGTPRFYLHHLLLTILWWLAAANTITMMASQKIINTDPPAVIAGGIQPTQLSGYVMSAAVFCIGAMALYALSVIMDHFKHLENKLVNTTHVTVAVCQALTSLDVNRATDHMDKYDAAADVAIQPNESSNEIEEEMAVHASEAPDRKLLDLLHATTHFIQTVVPHVPHWKQLELGFGRTRNSATEETTRDAKNNSNNNENDDADSMTSRSRHSSARTGTQSTLPPAQGLDEASVRRVSTALVDITVSRDALRVDDSPNLFAAYGQVLSHVLHTARTHEASIHSIVGDTVIATWNATGVCTRPEYFATRFAWRLRTKSGHEAASVSAAITTCDARCQSIAVATSATHFSSPLDGTSPPTRAMADLARRYHTVLIDGATQDASHVQRNFIARAVDVLPYLARLPTVAGSTKAALLAATANATGQQTGGNSPSPPKTFDSSVSSLLGVNSMNFGSSMAGPSPLAGSLAEPPGTQQHAEAAAIAALPVTTVFEVLRYADLRSSNGQASPEMSHEMRKLAEIVTRALIECSAGRYNDAVTLLNAVPYHTRRQRLVARLLSTAVHCADSGAVPPNGFAHRELYLASRELSAYRGNSSKPGAVSGSTTPRPAEQRETAAVADLRI